jgi:hypothetical protein
MDNPNDSSKPRDFGIDVRHNRSIGLRNLRFMPKNGKEKRNPLMVLKTLLPSD